MIELKNKLAEELARVTNQNLSDIVSLIEQPPNSSMGDFSFPCFKLSKELRKSPSDIANDLKSKVDFGDFVNKTEVVGGYLNIFLNNAYLSEQIITKIVAEKDKYGATNIGDGKNVVIDYSSPNIAKPFHIGHLRSTVIGGALYNIHNLLGYNCIGINHIGDWGTQFGLVIAGYKRWGNDEQINKEPIKSLLDLYVRINALAKEDETVLNEGRDWFKKLEDKDEEATRLWSWFREESLKELDKIYKILGCKFDSYNGEAFYNDKRDNVVKIMNEKGLLVESEGAKIVTFENEHMPPAMIIKSNGTTTYATRDLAAILYRAQEYAFEKAIYVTSYEQILHFKQIFSMFGKMGFENFAQKCHHVPFGMVHMKTGKMSTREGQVVFLEEILNESISKVKNIILEKNPNMENIDEIARKIGVGAVIFNDLKNNRIKDETFDWDEILKFDGETGPYVQYMYVRTQSILRKSSLDVNEIDIKDINFDNIKESEEIELIKILSQFDEILVKSANDYEPSIITRYVVDLAQAYASLYNNHQIITEDLDVMKHRLMLTYCSGMVMKNALKILGIECPDRM